MSPPQGARETRRESSPMLAGGAHGTVWDDSRCAPRAFSRRCSRTRAPLMYSGPRRAGTDGRTSLRTGPAPAALAGPNGGVLHLSEQNLPVAGRARNAAQTAPGARGWSNGKYLARFAARVSRVRAWAASSVARPQVHTRWGGAEMATQTVCFPSVGQILTMLPQARGPPPQ